MTPKKKTTVDKIKSESAKKQAAKKTTAKKPSAAKKVADTVSGEVPADGRHWLARVQPSPVETLGTTLTPEEIADVAKRLQNESTLLGHARLLRVSHVNTEIPKMSVGHKALKGVAPGGVVSNTLPDGPEHGGASPEFEFDSISIVTSKVVLPWTITEEFIEDNPAGDAAIHLIGDMMITQFANEAEDLSVNGDYDSSDALLRANDGWLKLARQDGNHLTSEVEGRVQITNVDLEAAFRALPLKYRRDPRKLRFFVSYDAEMDLLEAMVARSGGIKPVPGKLEYAGIPIVPSVYLPPGTVLLTDPSNMVFALQDDAKVRASWGGMTAIERDERYFALHVRIDFAFQNAEAVVLLEKTATVPEPPQPGFIHRLRVALANLIDPR